MSLQETSTGATTGRWAATGPGAGPGRGLVIAVTLLTAIALVVRLRQLGWVSAR